MGRCTPYNKEISQDDCDKQSSYAYRSKAESAKACLTCLGLDEIDDIGNETEEKKPDGIRCKDCEKIVDPNGQGVNYFYKRSGLCKKCHDKDINNNKIPIEQPPKKDSQLSKRTCKDCGVSEEDTDKFYPSTMQCRKHYMQGYREEVNTGKREVNRDTSNVVEVDFSQFPDLFEKLIALSKSEMRPPSMQILYMIKGDL